MGALIEIWVIINIAAFVCMFCDIILQQFDLSFVNPKAIYRNLPVNWFGTLLITIIVNIVLPVVSVPYWIYKICTVGRK